MDECTSFEWTKNRILKKLDTWSYNKIPTSKENFIKFSSICWVYVFYYESGIIRLEAVDTERRSRLFLFFSEFYIFFLLLVLFISSSIIRVGSSSSSIWYTFHLYYLGSKSNASSFGEPYWIRTNDTFLKRELPDQLDSLTFLHYIRLKESCTGIIQNIWLIISIFINNYAESYFLKVKC